MLAHDQLGRHPERGANHSLRALHGEPEVGELGSEVVVHEHVAGLEVVVQHRGRGRVEVHHARHHVLHQIENHGGIQDHGVVVHDIVQAPVLHELHHHQRLPLVVHHRAQHHGDVRVPQVHNDLQLGLELLVQLLVGGELNLECLLAVRASQLGRKLEVGNQDRTRSVILKKRRTSQLGATPLQLQLPGGNLHIVGARLRAEVHA
mmetsp:Transcript_3197/g.4316  ORF Transcript_3197/g.4316 Transcript_3197/m.4316 type:complete len:205 (+) Transcript_3197:1193-1807(+)